MPKPLTARIVDAAKPGKARKELPDGALPGLYLVIQPTGKKSWAVRYRHNGRPRKMTIGTVAPKTDGKEPAAVLDGPLSLAEARAVAREQLLMLATGEDPAEAKALAREEARREGPAKDSFEAVACEFIERHAKPRNRTWEQTVRHLGLGWDPAFSGPRKKAPLIVVDGAAAAWRDRKITEISRSDIVKVLDGIVDRGSPGAANLTLSTIRKLFNWCVERGILQFSPASGIKRPASTKSRERYLTEQELAAVWRAACTTEYPFGQAFQLLILTGARRQEIGALRWAEIEKDTIVLKGERTKTNEPRKIPLSIEAYRVLGATPKIGTGGFVFTGTGDTPVSGWSKAKRMLDDAATRFMPCEESSDVPVTIPEWRTHDLRRTVATGLQRLGFRLEVIESVLGHTSGTRAGIVGVYQRHAFEPEKREALETWGRYVRLLAHPHVWKLLGDHLDAHDVAIEERYQASRARNRQFCQKVTAGGREWITYVRSVVRRKQRYESVARLSA